MSGLYSRRSVIVGVGVLVATVPRAVLAQRQSGSVKRVGVLAGSQASLLAAFEDEMRRLGYVSGTDVVIETRIVRQNTPDVATLAAELARLEPDVVVAGALPHALELRNAAPMRPLVIATCPGMVSNGFAASLDYPGGHATGIDELPPGVTAKRLKLLKTAVPSVLRVALLSTTPGHGGHEAQLEDAQGAASTLGVTVKPYRAASVRELNAALQAIVDDRMEGLVNFQGGLSVVNRQIIVDFVAQQRVPAIYQATLFADAGGLMAWAPDLEEQYRVAARYVDQILKGAKPGDLPIRYPSGYFLTINKKAADALGLRLPPALLVQVDRLLS